MNKIYITAKILIHPTQAAIIKGLKSGKIKLGVDSLRDIAELSGLPKESPQKVKHHLGQLVKLGIIDIRAGEYFYK